MENLRWHEKYCHKTEIAKNCEACSITFCTQFDYRNHLKNKHKGRVPKSVIPVENFAMV